MQSRAEGMFERSASKQSFLIQAAIAYYQYVSDRTDCKAAHPYYGCNQSGTNYQFYRRSQDPMLFFFGLSVLATPDILKIQ